MIKIEYEDEELKLLIETGKSKKYKKLKSNATFQKDLSMVMSILQSINNIKDLAPFKKLNYEKLHYSLEGYSSIRIGFTSKYRLIFTEFDEGIRICLIEINEHYGDK